MVIWKYPLSITPYQLIDMPTDAKPLCVQVQNGVPTLWVMVDQSKAKIAHGVSMVGTGHEFHEVDHGYIGSVQVEGLVWHYFWDLS